MTSTAQPWTVPPFGPKPGPANIFGPPPGSEAIGTFAIGVGQIGRIPPFNWRATLLSQYANSPTIVQLVTNFAAWLDQTANIEQFFQNIWDIDTAVGVGLDIWGRIVGVQRTVKLLPVVGTFFGFEEMGQPTAQPWNVAPFFGGFPSGQGFTLADPAFKTLILAKALANITDGSIKALNQILLSLFPNRGNCFVIDNQNMTMVLRFQFAITAVEQAIITESGVFPKSTGVLMTVVSGM